jgi:hypothetical protein
VAGVSSLRVRRAVGVAIVVVVVLAFVLTTTGLTPVGVAWTAGLFAVVAVLIALLRS